jgi:hypothetical protein
VPAFLYAFSNSRGNCVAAPVGRLDHSAIMATPLLSSGRFDLGRLRAASCFATRCRLCTVVLPGCGVVVRIFCRLSGSSPATVVAIGLGDSAMVKQGYPKIWGWCWRHQADRHPDTTFYRDDYHGEYQYQRGQLFIAGPVPGVLWRLHDAGDGGKNMTIRLCHVPVT